MDTARPGGYALVWRKDPPTGVSQDKRLERERAKRTIVATKQPMVLYGVGTLRTLPSQRRRLERQEGGWEGRR